MRVMFVLWLMHICMAAWLVEPIAIFGRRRAGWETWELLVFVVPYWMWAVLMLSPAASGRTLADLGDAIFISIAIVTATAVRVAWGSGPHKRLLSGILMAGVAGVGIVTATLV